MKIRLHRFFLIFIIFPLDFFQRCGILARIIGGIAAEIGRYLIVQGHSSTVEYRSPKPRMRVRFLLPLPEFWGNNGRKTGENWATFMKKILEFIKSVRAEWFKIVWPTRDEVMRATIMILVFSGLAALFFFVVDSALNAIVSWIF